eukprot:GHRR01021045.1.p2 GENE.GHRR01021045.1~~GHRR01021045.1.p2  ORF type:complete len:110 (-),score=37.40 GHRR01021045.1:844-1173(-)
MMLVPISGGMGRFISLTASNSPRALSRQSHVSPAEPLPSRCFTSYTSDKPPVASFALSSASTSAAAGLLQQAPIPAAADNYTRLCGAGVQRLATAAVCDVSTLQLHARV